MAGAAIMPSVMVLALSQVAPAFARGAFGLIRCATTVSVLLALSRSRLYAGSAEIPAGSPHMRQTPRRSKRGDQQREKMRRTALVVVGEECEPVHNIF